MSKPFSAFYDYVLPELPGCTTAMVNHHLRETARAFCEETCAWRADTIPVDSEPDTLTYAVVLPDAYVELVRVTRLTIDGVLQWQDTQPDADDKVVPRYVPHKPPFSLDEDAALFTLKDQPAGPIVFTAAMKPSLDAPELPDVMLTMYVSAMRVGTLGRLMLMGGKKWSNPDLGSFYLTEFAGHMTAAGINGARSNVRAPLRTKPSRI